MAGRSVRVLGWLVLILLVLVVLAWSAVSSGVGARLVMNALVANVEGLQIARVEGRLIGPLRLYGLDYRQAMGDAAGGAGSDQPVLKVSVPEAELDWSPAALLSGELKVVALKVQGLHLILPPSSESSESFQGFVLPESLPLPVSVRAKGIVLESVTVDSLAAGDADQVATSVTAEHVRGFIRWNASPDAVNNQLKVGWEGLRLYVPGEPASTATGAAPPQLLSKTAQWQIDGALDAFELQGNLLLQDARARSAKLVLHGQGNRRAITLGDIQLKALGGSAQGSASIDWATGLDASLVLEGREFDPARWDERWPGEVNFSLRAAAASNVVRVEALKVFGRWQDQPLQLDAQLTSQHGSTTVETLRLQAGSSNITAQGVIAQSLDFNWQLASPDLGALWPGLQGRLHSEGRLQGAPDRPAVTGTFVLQSAAYQDYAVDALEADIDLNLSGTDVVGRSNALVKGQGIRLGSTRVASLNVNLQGSSAAHTLRVDVASEAGTLRAALKGGLAQGVWEGVVSSASVQPLALAPWQLGAPQSLVLDSESQLVERGCWRSGDATLCFEGQRSGAGTLAQFAVDALPFDYFAAELPEELRVTGSVSGQASVEQRGDEPLAIAASLTTSQALLERLGGDPDDFAESLALDPGGVAVDGTIENLRATLELPFAAGGGVQGDVRLSGGGALSDALLEGTVTATVPSLGFLGALSPEVERVRGSAQLDIVLGGNIVSPKVQGELRLEDMQIGLASAGLLLEAVSMRATSDANGNIAIEGAASSDGGSLRWEGEGRLRDVQVDGAGGIALSNFQGRVTGEEFQFWNSSEAAIWGSPALTLSLQDNTVHFKGDMLIPRARITPTQLPPSAVGVTSDQVIVLPQSASAGAAGVPVPALAVHSALRLELGDKVEIDGFGFKGNLQGALAIRQSPGKPVLASGELNVVNGEYRAFGQGLVIERGQLLFAGGDIENPGLNIRAQRRPASDIVVGVNVTGQLQKPSLAIFSEPVMSSSNQLSWLVLGRPFENTSGAETDYIAQAALLLGIQGGDYLAKGIGEKLGLDTIGIETGSGEAGAASDVNQAALVVGKYLTPRLYISYGVGLLESISTVKLRYQISDRWNLVTESSAIASGGDINFTIER